MSKISQTEYLSWADQFEVCSALTDVWLYFFLYFFAVYAPYFCAVLVLLAPLAAALFLFAFGYLIGYVFAGRLASFIVFFAALSSYYLAFAFPYFRD